MKLSVHLREYLFSLATVKSPILLINVSANIKLSILTAAGTQTSLINPLEEVILCLSSWF